MSFVRIDLSNGKFGGKPAQINRDGSNGYKDFEDLWELKAGEYLELVADVPTGRVFDSSLTSEVVKAFMPRQCLIDIRRYVTDLDPDITNWTSTEKEIEETYFLLVQRDIEIEMTTYQYFIGLLLAENLLSQTEHDDIKQGKLLREYP